MGGRVKGDVIKRGTEFEIAFKMVNSLFKDTIKTTRWFRTPNEKLGGLTPKELINDGQFLNLKTFINANLI